MRYIYIKPTNKYFLMTNMYTIFIIYRLQSIGYNSLYYSV